MSDLVPISKESLTLEQYRQLEDVPPELEWLATITNEKTRRFYKRDVEEFSRFAGLNAPRELRTVARAHVIAWRKSLEARKLGPAKKTAKFTIDTLVETLSRIGKPVKLAIG